MSTDINIGIKYASSDIVTKIIAVLAFLSIVTIGVSTEPFLGDETWHLQLASTIYQTGERPAFNPLLHHSDVGQLAYITDILWHYGLVFFWKLTGGVSIITAQLYNASYCLLLIIGVFLLTKELYGAEKGLNSVLVVLSVPMVPIFSVVLHFDIAVAALSTFCLLMLARRRYFLTGIFLGLSFLMKRNVCLIVPAIIFLTLFDSKEGIKGWSKRFLLLLSPFVLILSPDAYFKIKNFGLNAWLLYPITPKQFILDPLPFKTHNVENIPFVFYDVSNPLFDPTAIFTFFGPVFFTSLGLYLVIRNKKDDWFLIIPSASGLLLFSCLAFFGNFTPLLRYLTPLVPPLGILGSLGIASVNNRVVRAILIVGCVMQFAGALAYIYLQRKIPIEMKEVYTFVKNSTPENARIMTPWGSQLAFYTGRISHWTSYCCHREIEYLFWQANEKETLEIMKRYGTNYILIEKVNIYDDSKVHHFGRYPNSFIKKIETFSSLKPIFENHAATLWKIQEKIGSDTMTFQRK
ncbi:MAG TPA: ArnT family glycosyltransferase [Candidatus Hypogeohydataceae bacterium YC41]